MVFATTALLAAAVVSTAAANSVTLYDNPFFQGEAFTMWVNPNYCANVGSYFNDRASSSLWQLDHGVGGWIFFFEHNDCQGQSRAWSVDANGYPNNFAVDGIDNAVSSVMFTNDEVSDPRPPDNA